MTEAQFSESMQGYIKYMRCEPIESCASELERRGWKLARTGECAALEAEADAETERALQDAKGIDTRPTKYMTEIEYYNSGLSYGPNGEPLNYYTGLPEHDPYGEPILF